MDDIVNRQTVADAVLEYMAEHCGAAFDENLQNGLRDKINSLPKADEPEIVYCKDCKYCKYQDNYCFVLKWLDMKLIMKTIRMVVKGDGAC